MTNIESPVLKGVSGGAITNFRDPTPETTPGAVVEGITGSLSLQSDVTARQRDPEQVRLGRERILAQALTRR